MKSLAPSLALLLAAGLLAAPDQGPEPGDIVPGKVPVGALLNVQALVADFPHLAHQGRLAAWLDAQVEAGVPDPRSALDQLGLGATLDHGRPVAAVAVGLSRLPVVPLSEAALRKLGIGLDESAYRGVRLLTPVLPGTPVRFAEVGPDAPLLAWSKAGTHPLAEAAIDSRLGLAESFSDAFGARLTPDVYAIAGLRLPTSLPGGEGPWPGVHLQGRATVVLARQGSLHARLAVEATCKNALEARVLALSMAAARDRLADEVTDPDLKALIASIVIQRQGSVVRATLELPRDRLEALLLALE